MAEGFLKSHELEKRQARQSQEELLSLCDLVAKLAKVVEGVEDGLYPIMRKGGLKEAFLPEGLKPRPPSPGTYPQLFRALGESHKCTALGDADTACRTAAS